MRSQPQQRGGYLSRLFREIVVFSALARQQDGRRTCLFGWDRALNGANSWRFRKRFYLWAIKIFALCLVIFGTSYLLLSGLSCCAADINQKERGAERKLVSTPIVSVGHLPENHDFRLGVVIALRRFGWVWNGVSVDILYRDEVGKRTKSALFFLRKLFPGSDRTIHPLFNALLWTISNYKFVGASMLQKDCRKVDVIFDRRSFSDVFNDIRHTKASNGHRIIRVLYQELPLLWRSRIEPQSRSLGLDLCSDLLNCRNSYCAYRY